MPTHDFDNGSFMLTTTTTPQWIIDDLFNNLPAAIMSNSTTVDNLVVDKDWINIRSNKKRRSYIMPSVTKVTHTKDGTTVVFYDDGTKSWVRPAEGTEPDPFVGFCMAVMKRLYGSTTNIIKDYEKHLTGGGANGCKKGKHDK